MLVHSVSICCKRKHVIVILTFKTKLHLDTRDTKIGKAHVLDALINIKAFFNEEIISSNFKIKQVTDRCKFMKSNGKNGTT